MASQNLRVSSFFDGYSAECISEWCAVSLKTARLYKSGRRKPSRQALLLFTFRRQGRLLVGSWAQCSVRGDCLIDPDGATLTVGQLRAYWIVMQLAAELARKAGPEAQERHYRALGIA